MYTEIIWTKNAPCILPDKFDPFLIKVIGGKDCLSLGSLKAPLSYKNNESKLVIEWIAHELIFFILMENSQDLTELTIKSHIDSGNWILKRAAEHELDNEATKDYKILTNIFKKFADKTRSNTLNRSSNSKNGNRTSHAHLHAANRLLSHLFENDAQIISDHLHHGKRVSSIIDPPSEFCVVETARYMAKLVELEETLLSNDLFVLKNNSSLTEYDINLFFKNTKNYRYSFLYLFIAITGINSTNAMLISLTDLNINNNKNTSGKTVTVYKPRANRVVSFEIPKDILIKYIKPYVTLFTTYNALCNKFNVDLELDFIGRQIFWEEDDEYRHISQYYLFTGWLKTIKPRLINHLRQLLQQENIFDHVIKVPTPRDLRNYKATTIESKYGHNLSAIIMQHSTKTALKYYYRRQEKEAIENMGEFYADFESIIKNIGDKVKDRLTIIPAGICKASDNQQSIIQLNTTKSAYIVGDCTTPTGCLFCSFFVAHAEENGVYKLLSMKQYILLKNEVVSYHSEIESSYGAIIERINHILEHLVVTRKNEARQWIEQAENKVAYELHPVWQELYDMDMALLEGSK